jgi:hypothetical protein
MKHTIITATFCIAFLLADKNAAAQNNAAKAQQQAPVTTGQAALITDPKAPVNNHAVNAVEIKAAKPAEGLTPKNIDRPKTSTIVEAAKKNNPPVTLAPQVVASTKAN